MAPINSLVSVEAVVGPDRFELSTPRLSSVCSNQLSYGPSPAAVVRFHARLATGLAKSSSVELEVRRETKTAANRKMLSTSEDEGACPSRSRGLAFTNILTRSILRKEVIQPQVPLRLPCYDFTPVADPTVVSCLLAVSALPSGRTNSHGVTGGVYKARERIHRGMLIRDY